MSYGELLSNHLSVLGIGNMVRPYCVHDIPPVLKIFHHATLTSLNKILGIPRGTEKSAQVKEFLVLNALHAEISNGRRRCS
jgi:hypothetical protein